MDIGIVRLIATVAISDDVRKHPLLAEQPHLITVKFNNTLPDNNFLYGAHVMDERNKFNTRDK
jgi:hypothetical protein